MDDPIKPGGVNSISESNNTSSDFTRRSLLQGAATTSILLPGTAWAAEPIRYDLALSLSQNERVLTVTERRIFVDHEKVDNPKWIVRAVLFGPKAWFSLIKPTSDDRQILKVFDCRYGGHGGELTFVFTRDNDKSPWFIDLTTNNVWNGLGAGKVGFADFAGASKKLKIARVASSQADAALLRIFQNHVRIGRQAAATCDITFDNQLQWKISSTHPRTFSLFGGQAWLKEFAFGWRTDQDEIADKTAIGDVFLQGQGSVRTDGFDGAKIVVGVGHCVNLNLQKKDSPREFDVRIGSSPLDPAVEQIISRLRLGESQITVTDERDTKAASISCRDLVLSQTVLPKTGSLRTVMFGSAGLAVDPIVKATSASEEIVTPIGRLTVAALPPDQAVKIGDQRAPDAQQPVVEPVPKADLAAQQKREQAAARKRERELFFRAACGDRGGAREATLWVFKKFMDRVVGAEPIEDLMAGRLSGPTRLAFRVNCAPPPNATSLEAGLGQSSGVGPSAPGGGDFAYRPIQFTFEALTDWSRHEPAVTRRAQKLFTALPGGVVPPLGERAASLGDHDILAFQGFTKGFITAEQRLGEIRNSMARKPTEFETAIEIPSRLILSTAQDAIWQTVRHLPASATELNNRVKPPLEPKDPSLESGLHQQVAGEISIHQAGLWTARLAVEDVNPGLRIVDTPDFRPMVLAPQTAGSAPPLPGRGAPPRGPIAPWFVGPEQMESTTVTAADVNGSLPVDTPGKAKGEVCPAPSDEPSSVPDKVFRVLRWLCGRAASRKEIPVNWWTFRTTLDAYDRHQLVMLSSAYGLPVIGRRQAVKDDDEAVGPLIVDSGQFEPGTEQEYALSDARNDQAIYRPIPLNVRELSLTALGGSFSHDTAFQPSAGADDLWGRKLFEGFSIERWQQEIVLGRDIIGQVVYKGYLFPFGHPASMIKQTERIFLRTPTQGIKAILRQRIFLHVAQPLQRFPTTGQPHRGALWCGESVTLRTIWTPDILDPNTGDFGPNDESLNGRISLGAGNPGLAFFPRTDITERGLVSFELLVDGAGTRMPLIFVDNIAATTPTSLRALIAHYEEKTKMPISRRTLAMNSQKIRYAPERNSGDTTLTTESIQVTAHGRFKDFGGGWAGDLSTYNTTGTLEGARQPPFYPAMDFAIIRLEQVERFSGGNRKPVKAQYDGHYIRHGFAPIPAADAKGDEAEPEWNPMEVYLNLRSIVTSSMGDNGAQAAAIGRPASNIVAVSRAKGPLGADRFVKYELIGDDNPKSQAPESQTSKPIIIPDKPDGAELLTEDASWRNIKSLASYFNHRHSLTANQTDGKPYEPVERPDPAPVDVVEVPEIPENVLKTLQVLQSYFSGDAKLLGTVKIKYLLALLGLDDFLAGVPVRQPGRTAQGRGHPRDRQSGVRLHRRFPATCGIQDDRKEPRRGRPKTRGRRHPEVDQRQQCRRSRAGRAIVARLQPTGSGRFCKQPERVPRS